MNVVPGINDFLEQKSIAVVGVSRSGKKFGNSAVRELRTNGYRIYPVHPSATEIEGLTCYPSLREIPEQVGGLLIIVPPPQTEIILREAAAVGIRRVWMQQGSSSVKAINFCRDNNIGEIHGQCILMFLDKSNGFHRFHRRIWNLFHRFQN